ncbi:MAG: anthranilate synthase component 2, partial [Marinoscillum sp.]
MGKVLVIDNYDSFTYNLVHILRELGMEDVMEVHRNDKIAVDYAAQFDHILLSPGPGLPSDAGIMPAVIAKYAA